MNSLNKPVLIHPNKLVSQHEAFIIDKALANKIKTVKSTIQNGIKPGKKINFAKKRDLVKSQPYNQSPKMMKYNEFQRTTYHDDVQKYFKKNAEFVRDNDHISDDSSKDSEPEERQMPSYYSTKDLLNYRRAKLHSLSKLKIHSPQGDLSHADKKGEIQENLSKPRLAGLNLEADTVEELYNSENNQHNMNNYQKKKSEMVNKCHEVNGHCSNLDNHICKNNNTIHNKQDEKICGYFEKNECQLDHKSKVESPEFIVSNKDNMLIKKNANRTFQIKSRKGNRQIISHIKENGNMTHRPFTNNQLHLNFKNDEIVEQSNLMVEKVIMKELKRPATVKCLQNNPTNERFKLRFSNNFEGLVCKNKRYENNIDNEEIPNMGMDIPKGVDSQEILEEPQEENDKVCNGNQTKYSNSLEQNITKNNPLNNDVDYSIKQSDDQIVFKSTESFDKINCESPEICITAKNLLRQSTASKYNNKSMRYPDQEFSQLTPEKSNGVSELWD